MPMDRSLRMKISARSATRATLLRFEVSDHLQPLRIGPFGFAKFVDIVSHTR
jgi:hypothetical protein